MTEIIQRHKNKPMLNIISIIIFLTVLNFKINEINMLLVIPSMVSIGIFILGKLIHIYLEICGFLIITIIGIVTIAAIISQLNEAYKEYIARKELNLRLRNFEGKDDLK